MSITTTHIIESLHKSLELEISCSVRSGLAPCRSHDGDPDEVEIEDVFLDGERLTGDKRLLAIACIGVDEIEIQAINEAKNQNHY